MCGIIAVARRRSDRTPPDSAEVLALVSGAASAVDSCRPGREVQAVLDGIAADLGSADTLLRGTPGVRALRDDSALVAGLEGHLSDVAGALAALDGRLDEVLADRPTAEQEAINASLVAVRDA